MCVKKAIEPSEIHRDTSIDADISLLAKAHAFILE